MKKSMSQELNGHSGLPRFRPVFWVALLALGSAGCGGSGGDASGVARDGLNQANLSQADSSLVGQDGVLQQDSPTCSAEVDIADFVLTEIDRQWSCAITTEADTRFDNVYFSREGTAVFANDGVWYWNRFLPSDAINLAAPGESTRLMSEISSSNTVLEFKTTTGAGDEQRYDCVLVPREVNS